MKIEHLKYLLNVSKSKSFSIGAKLSHVTQPTVSQAIKNIEKELNVKIFNRTNNGAVPTTEGMLVIQFAKDIVDLYSNLNSKLNVSPTLTKAYFKISIVPSMSTPSFTDAVLKLRKLYPLLDIEIFEKGSKEIINDIQSSKTDLGIIGHPINWDKPKNIKTEKLIRSRIKVCLKNSPELSDKKSITVDEISKYPIAMLENGYYLHIFVKDFFLKNRNFETLITAGNTNIIKNLILENNALGFFTEFSLVNEPYLLNGDIIALEVEDESDIFQYSYIQSIYNNNSEIISSFKKIFTKELIEFSKSNNLYVS